jgi:hypothetical protein
VSELKEPYFFVGEHGETSHDDTIPRRIGGWPVFATYDRSNPDEKHYFARFCHLEHAEEWAFMMNTRAQHEQPSDEELIALYKKSVCECEDQESLNSDLRMNQACLAYFIRGFNAALDKWGR